MTGGALADLIVRLAGAIGLPAVLGGWLLDRRSHRAAGEVSERTVGASVARADAGALEAHVLAVERAFEIERNSKDRVIRELKEGMEQLDASCQRRVVEVTQEGRRKDALIGQLREEVATLTGKLSEVTADLTALRDRLEGTT